MRPVVVSLFSGAGGLDLGLLRAGFDVRVCVESSRWAVETLRANLKDAVEVIPRDIRTVSGAEILARLNLGVGDVDLVAGGPPCQRFSTAGRNRREPVRDLVCESLLSEFARIVEETLPRYFLIENVPQILTSALCPGVRRSERVIEWLAERAARLGYSVTWGVVNAADYGVPQLRFRAIIVGTRLGGPVAYPPRTHHHVPTAHRRAWVTFAEAMEGLREDKPVCLQFSSRQKAIFAHIRPGGDWRDLPGELVDVAMAGSRSRGGKTSWWRRIAPDRPAPTVVSRPTHRATPLCHPTELRPLTVRECARLQGFPDNWVFCGSPSQQYLQVGNATPVALAEALGRQLLRHWRGEPVAVLRRVDMSLSRSGKARVRVGVWGMRERDASSGGRAATDLALAAIFWYRREGRRYPWRLTRDPYRVLVAEILLQRTPRQKVEGVYEAFVETFPTVAALAAADVAAVRKLISSLGLSQRADRLVRMARYVASELGGVLPDSTEALLKLPGVGPYVARAVECFACGKAVPLVDGVAGRVYRRVLGLPGTGYPGCDKGVWAAAERLVPGEEPRSFNYALLDIGALFCRSKNPGCTPCPLRRHCAWAAAAGGGSGHGRDAGREPRPTPTAAVGEESIRGHLASCEPGVVSWPGSQPS